MFLPTIAILERRAHDRQRLPLLPAASGANRTGVMNLSHFATAGGAPAADEIGFVWGERSWTWSDLDRRVDAMAAALAAKGIRKGDRVLVQSKNCNQMFESMFACFRLGAVWVPTNFRQTPDEVAYLGAGERRLGMICHSDFPEHAAACARGGTGRSASWSPSGASSFGEDYDALVEHAHVGQTVPTAAVEHDDPVLVLLHLRHDRAPEGRRAHPWPDGLRDHQPSLRPDAGHDPGGRLAGGRAALAWRGRPSARAGRRAARQDDPAVERSLRYRRGLDDWSSAGA